jgi:hypothetical protein
MTIIGGGGGLSTASIASKIVKEHWFLGLRE